MALTKRAARRSTSPVIEKSGNVPRSSQQSYWKLYPHKTRLVYDATAPKNDRLKLVGLNPSPYTAALMPFPRERISTLRASTSLAETPGAGTGVLAGGSAGLTDCAWVVSPPMNANEIAMAGLLRGEDQAGGFLAGFMAGGLAPPTGAGLAGGLSVASVVA